MHHPCASSQEKRSRETCGGVRRVPRELRLETVGARRSPRCEPSWSPWRLLPWRPRRAHRLRPEPFRSRRSSSGPGRATSQLPARMHGQPSRSPRPSSGAATAGEAEVRRASTAPGSSSRRGHRPACGCRARRARWARRSTTSRSTTCVRATSSGGPVTSASTRGRAGRSRRSTPGMASCAGRRAIRTARCVPPA